MRKNISFLASILISWVVPLVVSFFFFDQKGQLVINFWLFKAIMVFVLGLVSFLLFRFLAKKFTLNINQKIVLSLVAIAINIGLDLVTIVPLAGYKLSDYLVQVALIYVVVFPLSIFVAFNSKVKLTDKNS